MTHRILLEYGLTQPAHERLPFDAWFVEHPDARVYATGVQFDGPVGRALYIPMPQDPELVANVLALPAPNAHRFEPTLLKGGLRVIEAEWSEPIFPGVFSPMAVNARALGPGAACAVTITRREVRHRVLAPSRDSTATLWRDIHRELDRYCGLSGTNVRLDLARLAPWEVPDEPAAARHAGLKFQLGAFNTTRGDAVAEDLATVAALGGHAIDTLTVA